MLQLPKIACGFDYVLVVVDRLSKTTHFILYSKTYNALHVAKIFSKDGDFHSLVTNYRCLIGMLSL